MSIALDVANKLYSSEARFEAETSVAFVRKTAGTSLTSEEDREADTLFTFSDGSQYAVKKDGELNTSVHSPQDIPVITPAEQPVVEEAPVEETSTDEASEAAAPVKPVKAAKK